MKDQAQAAAPAQPNADAQADSILHAKSDTPAPAPKVDAQAKGEENLAAKGKESVEQKPVVPEKYDVKLPKDSHLNAEHVEKLSAYARSKGLSNEQAQALLDREHETVSSFVEAQKAHLAKQADEVWIGQIKADPEFGGDKLKESTAHAHRFMNKYASPELKKLLNDTGYGNHPELFRAFARAGREMADDKILPGGGLPGAKKSPEDIFYGNKK